MNKIAFLTLLVFSLISCSSNEDSKNDALVSDSVPATALDSLQDQIVSDYDLSGIDAEHVKEFAENLILIEKKDGIQWDFCKCVIKNAEVDKVLKSDDLTDLQTDSLLTRLDFIEVKCQAYLIHNMQVTPDQRAAHEKKVRDCLNEAKQ